MKFAFIIFLFLSTLSADERLCEELFAEHMKMLSHTEVAHPPLVVCFSATPGMGKTYIAKLVEEKYQAVRISTDAVRDLIRKSASTMPREETLDEYLNYFLTHYKAPNHFFILDASIDRTYKRLFALWESKSVPFIVVRLEVPRQDVAERLSASYLPYLDLWQKDYDAFSYPATIVIKNGKQDSLDLQPLFSTIEAKSGSCPF